MDQARHESADPPDGPELVVVTRKSGGRPGRPRVEIDPTFLREALALRGPSGLKPIFSCDARTVRRRALEYGIATPGTPVFVSQMQPDGGTNAVRSRSTRGISALTNDELDALLSSILEIFPTFGQRMIAGRLKASGHHVPRECITESFLRVHGTPGVFGQRTIHRKVYKVAGANSLWHHDGQHGRSQNTLRFATLC